VQWWSTISYCIGAVERCPPRSSGMMETHWPQVVCDTLARAGCGAAQLMRVLREPVPDVVDPRVVCTLCAQPAWATLHPPIRAAALLAWHRCRIRCALTHAERMRLALARCHTWTRLGSLCLYLSSVHSLAITDSHLADIPVTLTLRHSGAVRRIARAALSTLQVPPAARRTLWRSFTRNISVDPHYSSVWAMWQIAIHTHPQWPHIPWHQRVESDYLFATTEPPLSPPSAVTLSRHRLSSWQHLCVGAHHCNVLYYADMDESRNTLQERS
jgi:hypothetical protein